MKLEFILFSGQVFYLFSRTLTHFNNHFPILGIKLSPWYDFGKNLERRRANRS